MAEIVQKDPVTDATGKHLSNRSHFSLGAPRFNTYRFGEYGVMDAVEIVPDDKNFRYSPHHDLRTYTLAQPLMSKAMIKKDMFYVPAQCILPFNWDKVYTNPLHGDDVNAGDVGCTVHAFSSKVTEFFGAMQACLSEHLASNAASQFKLNYLLKYWLSAEMFFSNGCLLNALGIKLSSLVYSGSTRLSFDKSFDLMCSYIVRDVVSFSVTGILRDDLSTMVYTDESAVVGNNALSFRKFLSYARDDFSWAITGVQLKSGVSQLPVMPTLLFYDTQEFAEPVNLARPIAYQICCAHYYSNDKIDYVYDANLYRQNVLDCLIRFAESGTMTDLSIDTRFTLNGSSYRYDSLSAFYFNKVIGQNILVGDYTDWLDDLSFFGDYFRLLFGYNRSLRFADYFTNSKSQPLAVGNQNVAVGNNQVNVLDMAKGIQVNRFLNAVNRFGRRISEYTKGLFPGVHQTPDFHDPFFLGHTTDVIGRQEIENTGTDQFDRQNSVSTILRSDAGQYVFETDFEKPGIFVSIVYFDIERAYANGIEKAVTHVDRYDMFNPFLQFVGDQPINASELDARLPGVFGYGLRYMEYKTRYPELSGGFVENLPGYAFKADESRLYDLSSDQTEYHVSPSFIRSIPNEIDSLYLSITGYSLGSYWHFIVVNNNGIEVDRPMAYAPSLL